MIVHDLRMPMMLAPKVIETDAHPLELLVALKDRRKAVMMSYAATLQPLTHLHSFVWFGPESGEFGSAISSDGQEAWALAQAEYQRATGPSQASH